MSAKLTEENREVREGASGERSLCHGVNNLCKSRENQRETPKTEFKIYFSLKNKWLFFKEEQVAETGERMGGTSDKGRKYSC